MDFAISEKMKTILEMVNEFVDKELIPLEPEMARLSFKEMLPVLREKQKKVRQMELWAPNFPQDCGGLGLSLVDHGLLSEALGRTPLGHYVFWCQAPDAAMWKFYIYTEQMIKKKDFSNHWWPVTSGAAFQ